MYAINGISTAVFYYSMWTKVVVALSLLKNKYYTKSQTNLSSTQFLVITAVPIANNLGTGYKLSRKGIDFFLVLHVPKKLCLLWVLVN